MKKIKPYIPLLLFAVFMLGYSLFNVLSPAKPFSEMENRPLAQMPAPTVKSVWENEFSTRFETYISDQFALRNQWISTKSVLESALGKLENNDIVYGKDDYMFDKTLHINEQQLQRNTEYLQQFSQLEVLKGKPVYFTLVPSASNLLADKLPMGLPLADERGAIATAYETWQAKAPTQGQVLDVTPALEDSPSAYLYYRTDHHWTTDGAYAAYASFIQELGLDPVAKEELSSHSVADFYGTYYSKAKKLGTVPDVITWYDLPIRSLTIDNTSYDSLYDLPQFELRDKYAAFLHSNHGVTVIESDSPTVTPGSSIMLFKDSYGNSYAPFLTLHFETVVVVDARYLPTALPVLEEYPVDMYHVMYSFKNFTEDDNIVKLSGLL